MPVLWPYRPNSISETLRFNTDVRRTATIEVRDSLHPGMTVFQFGYTFDDETLAAEALQRMLENLRGEWHVPIWTDLSYLDGVTLPATATTASVDTEADYRAGGLAIVSDDAGEQLVTVISAAAGTLTFAEPLERDFVSPIVAPVGTFIAPMGLSQSLAMTTTLQTVEFYRVDITDLAATSFPVFFGFDVLIDRQVVLQPLAGGLNQKIDFIQNGFGVMALMPLEDRIQWRGTVTFLDLEIDVRWARRQWLHHIRGRDRPFWLPTWKPDMIAITGSGPGAPTLAVNMITDTPANLVGRSVAVETTDGIIYRRINSAVQSGETIVLSLNTTHTRTIAAGASVSWLRLVRFDTDLFEFSHQIRPGGFASAVAASVVEVTT